MATATLTLTDEQIQTDVLDELKWEPRVCPNEIGVAVKDGVVMLTGWVDSYTKRWAAEDAAHGSWLGRKGRGRTRGLVGARDRRGGKPDHDRRLDASVMRLRPC
jgi:BON domain-containing protein